MYTAQAPVPTRAATLSQRFAYTLQTAKDSTADFVERRPYQALAIAAATGFLAGLILKRW